LSFDIKEFSVLHLFLLQELYGKHITIV